MFNFIATAGAAKITSWIVFAAIVGLIAWDVVVATNKERGDTISELLLKMAMEHPIIPLAIGILMGHLFWPQCKP